MVRDAPMIAITRSNQIFKSCHISVNRMNIFFSELECSNALMPKYKLNYQRNYYSQNTSAKKNNITCNITWQWHILNVITDESLHKFYLMTCRPKNVTVI